MVETSNVAGRGVSLIKSLLAEEARLREEKERTSGGKGQMLFVRGKKRELSVGEAREYTQAARRFSAELSPNTGSHSNIRSPGRSPTNDAPSPSLSHDRANGGGYNPNTPQLSRPFPTEIAITPPEQSLYEFGLAGSSGVSDALPSSVPQEFLNVFLTNGFDPLDGAITSFGNYGFSNDGFDSGMMDFEGSSWRI